MGDYRASVFTARAGSVLAMSSHKQFVEVLGRQMAYVEAGAGDPIVLLHGNPTSSYLWRSVIPALEGSGRCVAPDLIGMGDSGKLEPGPGVYRFETHRRYIDGLLESLGVDSHVTLVGHDWGGALLFDWAHRHPGAVKAIAYMETIVSPVEWSDWPEAASSIFQAMRSPAGESIVLEKNVFVERILPASALAPLSEDSLTEYRRPFLEPQHRWPTLTWPREIPIGGEPADVHGIVSAYSEWMGENQIPKLFVNAEPGSILTGRQRELCRSWPNQIEVTVPGSHFVQEDSGVAIGSHVADWLASL